VAGWHPREAGCPTKIEQADTDQGALMSFDKDTRNLLAKTVVTCRRRLVEDTTDQLRGLFGLHPDGTVLPLDKLTHLSPDQNAAARHLRDLLDHYTVGTDGNESDRRKAAYERMVLEISFTALNRLAALRLCEERGFIIECVRKGMSSDGFQMFERISVGALGPRYDTYRVFLECMFDELALDLGVLFDRTTPQSSVFPTERCMEDILSELNKPDLKHLWTEDETIGWIYQYFNPPEERKAMREASQAPRNSRELAVRNQFFTPRYVVEFLTDNTLGRIWYEMRKGTTALKAECRYLVRRQNEVFLENGDNAPIEPENENDLSQQEVIRRPFHIVHRPKKDPRDIRVLDPACGSGHFLLYAFDLLERIYDEAWAEEESPKSEVTGRSLRDDFETLDILHREAPKLIVEHNLHGIDIDPRAVQIAALAFWLRAQKTWKKLGLKAADRPRIVRANIVTAEPMPGEEDMRREFTANLKPRVLGQLIDVVFDKMKLAGDAGSLLKIEMEIKESVARARKQWMESPQSEQAVLFPELVKPKFERQQLHFDLSGVTDEQFWEQAEERILEALKDYTEKAENGLSVPRRLFAEDAARGFAFIEVCRKKYDVVLMNPPFGEPSQLSKQWIGCTYPITKNDILGPFLERAITVLNVDGTVGAITAKTAFQLSSMAGFRKELILKETTIKVFADLGSEVLDSAMVKTAAYVLRKAREDVHSVFINLTDSPDKAGQLALEISDGLSSKNVFWVKQTEFNHIPGSPLAYWADSVIRRCFAKFPSLASLNAEVKQGLGTTDDFRFVRATWEVSPGSIGVQNRWSFYAKGGESNDFYSDIHLVVNWADKGKEVYAFNGIPFGGAGAPIRNPSFYFKPGLTYTSYTNKGFSPRVLPSGCIFTTAGMAIFVSDPLTMLSLLNSRVIQLFLLMITDERKWEVGYVSSIPITKLNTVDITRLSDMALRGWREAISSTFWDETQRYFNAIAGAARISSLRTEPERLKLDSQNSINKLQAIRREIDELALASYGLTSRHIEFVNMRLGIETEENPEESNITASLVSLLVGIVFGRWDVRIAMDSSLAPRIPDPFDPLPVCPPGMLVSPDGLQAKPNYIASEEWLRARPNADTLPPVRGVKKPTIPDDSYPLRISWDGILVDDSGFNGNQPNRDDIVRRIREVMDLIWKEKAHDIEQEACEILGVSDLRDYFRRPAGFFQDHLKRYSKSRRKAPIYWPLTTASGSYTIWLYYHRLTDQTLYAAVNKHIEPKIDETERSIARIGEALKSASGRDVTRLTDQLHEAHSFLNEIRDLREELLHIAALPFKPNLNDGVIINAAPFHKLFRLRSWAKDTEDCWKKLEKGDYDWAHLAYTVWPERVRNACMKDRSIAIAHGLEDLCDGERRRVSE